ncbi:hypothetical protein [Kitasatospora sp. NPDC047058]|uniref:hypothetical protein n=1 Tax=Kitasatospora sp. NPDC047058 TaxID=3155620 RepID=UPI0033E34478
MSSPPVAPAPRRPLILLRATATATAALALGQTVLAGSFLNGHYDSLALHEAGAMTLAAAVLVQLVVAALVGRSGRGPRRPLVVAALLTAGVILQVGFGYDRTLGLHVVLGALLLSGTLSGAAGAWRLPLPARSPAPEVPDGPDGRGGPGGPGGPDGAGLLPRPGGPVEVAP